MYRSCGAEIVWCSRTNSGLVQSEENDAVVFWNYGVSSFGFRRFEDSKAFKDSLPREKKRLMPIHFLLETEIAWPECSICSGFSMRFAWGVNVCVCCISFVLDKVYNVQNRSSAMRLSVSGYHLANCGVKSFDVPGKILLWQVNVAAPAHGLVKLGR